MSTEPTYTAEQIAELARRYREAASACHAAYDRHTLTPAATLAYREAQRAAVAAMEALSAADPRHADLPAWYRVPAVTTPGPEPRWSTRPRRKAPVNIHGGFHAPLTPRKPRGQA